MKQSCKYTGAAPEKQPIGAMLIAGLAFAAMTAGWCMSAPTSAAAETESEVSSARVEQIVHDYLMRDPQVIYDALEELQRRGQEEKLAQLRRAALDYEGELYANPASPVGGNANGDVTLIEFFDYRCGYCRQAAASLEALIDTDDGVKVVFKDLPILGEDSERAARAALASREQGAYERFHFALMRTEDFSEQGLLHLAETNGLDAARLLEDMNGPDVSRIIEENRELAARIGVTGTPLFIIGDKAIPGAIELEKLQALAREARTS